MSQPNEESKKEKKINKSILKTLLYYSDDIALGIYKSIKPALRIKTATQKDYGGVNMGRQKVLSGLAAKLTKLATDRNITMSDEERLKMSDEERLKRQSRALAGIGAGALLAGLGLKGLAIAKGRKALTPKHQAMYNLLTPVLRDPLLYEHSPTYRKLNPWVVPLTNVGIVGLISGLVAGHEAKRRAKLKEEERKLTPEELVQAKELINKAKRLRKIQNALAIAGAGALAGALPLGIYSTKSILQALQAYGGRVNAKELFKLMSKKVQIADRLAGGLGLAGAGAFVGSSIADALAARKEDKVIGDSEIKRLAKRKNLMKALAAAGIISSSVLPIVGAIKRVTKDVPPEMQAYLRRLKPRLIEPILTLTSPTYARARMLSKGLGIAGLGALGAANVYGAEELEKRRKKLEEIEKRDFNKQTAKV